MRRLIVLGLLVSSTALAGRGGSTAAIKSAVASGSVDTIVAEIERAEELACLACIEPVRALVDHPSARVRDAAGWWLGRRGVRVEVMDAMRARLAAEDPTAARNAADVLAGLRDPAALPSLSAYVMKPLDEESGAAAARAIGAIGHPSALGALVTALRSSLPGVRAAAAAAVRDLRAPAGKRTVSDAAALVPLLSDGDATVRREAALSCGHLEDPAVVGALAMVLANDAVPVVRKAAAWALGQIGNGGAAAALTAAQSDADPLVRSIATAALARLK
jgi:HEAT repeat protein